MSKNKVIKSIGFNIMNENDAKILKAIKRRKNFSGYVKKLIMEDIEKKIEPVEVEKKEAPKPLTAAEKIAQLKKSGSNNPAPKTFFN